MFFWNSLAFSMSQRMLAIWPLVPLPFLKPAWTSGSSRFTYCWSLAWRILSITLLVREMSKPVWIMFSITCNERVPTAVLSQSQRSHCILIARVFSSKSSHPVHGCCWVSHVQVSATPWTVALQAPLAMNTGVGCHSFLQGIFLNSEIGPMSSTSPALAGRVFTASIIWEALTSWGQSILFLLHLQQLRKHVTCNREFRKCWIEGLNL